MIVNFVGQVSSAGFLQTEKGGVERGYSRGGQKN